MKGTYKRFDKKLYDENDAIGRQLAARVIKQAFGLTAVDNPDKEEVDLWLVRNNEVIAYGDAEVKLVWKTIDFPFSSVQFPERKGKYVNLDKPTVFVMINKQHNRALTVWGKDLVQCPLVEVPNKYAHSGELFYQVPLNLVTFHSII